MKYFETEGNGIYFPVHEKYWILSIYQNRSGKFVVREECDSRYQKKLTKEETLEMLQEAIDWVKSK